MALAAPVLGCVCMHVVEGALLCGSMRLDVGKLMLLAVMPTTNAESEQSFSAVAIYIV